MSTRVLIKSVTAVSFFAVTLALICLTKSVFPDAHRRPTFAEKRFGLADQVDGAVGYRHRKTVDTIIASRNLLSIESLLGNENTDQCAVEKNRNRNTDYCESKNATSIKPLLGKEDDDIECRSFHQLPFDERCDYIKNLSACQTDGGFIAYTQFIYCKAPNEKYVIPILLFFLCWVLYLFIALGATAEDYFCPSLNVISHTLRLSQNIAGVTFLAFGNGAPDIFSLVAAIKESHDGDAGLAFGALFGAGIFVTTIVTGAIAWVSPFKMAERPFLRDVIFYMAAVYWVYFVIWKQCLSLKTAIGMLALYAFYVVVVIVGRKINQMQRKRQALRRRESGAINSSLADPTVFTESDSSQPAPNKPSSNQHHNGRGPTVDIRNGLTATQILVASSTIARSASPHTVNPNTEVQNTQNQDSNSELTRLLGGGKKHVDKPMKHLLLEGICPINLEEWGDLSRLNKIYEIIKAPIQFCLQITIPVVDYDVHNHNWNKALNILHIVLGPLFFVFAIQGKLFLFYRFGGTELHRHISVCHVLFNSIKINGSGFLLWHLVFCISVLLATIVFVTTNQNKQPRFHSAYAYLGFLVAVVWIYTIANEIVNVLQTLGAVTKISDAILGLTLLAWGNSIGDLISNTTMARQGFPRMAISACFGGPFFNMLVGIGLSSIFKIAAVKSSFYIKHTNLQDILALFLLISLISSLILMLIARFKASRPYSIFLFILYALFLTFAILVETKVICWTYKISA
ncbi:mitochondrial sodium/calcium exchanger protein-like [Antedon mediterranea]|uniref:mitochondrial sodium/calcium exchanger protein-like n=1 Tax=Antedon mediterranea TaxID=105859 RepID=UPI003AF4E373